MPGILLAVFLKSKLNLLNVIRKSWGPNRANYPDRAAQSASEKAAYVLPVFLIYFFCAGRRQTN